MQRAIGAAVLILVSFGQVLAGADSASPLQIGSRLELFVDDHLIESMDGVRLQLHKPLPAGTVMKHDKPWKQDGSRGSSTFCHVTDFSSSRDGPYHAVPLASTPAEVARHTDHGQPFLARRVSQDWLASRLWSHAYFHQLFRGHDLFSSTFSTAAAPQFTPDYPNHAVYYGIFLNNATLAALVATDYQYPHFIPQSMRLRGNEWVHWGHPPCGAKRHMDLTCTARVSVQVRGRKRWRLYPLTTSPAWSQVLRPLEVVLGPGDALVWFPGWEHETGIEAGPSVSLSLHFTPNHSSHYISSFPELLSARVSKTCNWGQPK